MVEIPFLSRKITASGDEIEFREMPSSDKLLAASMTSKVILDPPKKDIQDFSMRVVNNYDLDEMIQLSWDESFPHILNMLTMDDERHMAVHTNEHSIYLSEEVMCHEAIALADVAAHYFTRMGFDVPAITKIEDRYVFTIPFTKEQTTLFPYKWEKDQLQTGIKHYLKTRYPKYGLYSSDDNFFTGFTLGNEGAVAYENNMYRSYGFTSAKAVIDAFEVVARITNPIARLMEKNMSRKE